MKRAIVVIFVTSAWFVGFFSLRGTMPFLHSRSGMIYTIIILMLLAIFLYGGEIIRAGTLLLRAIFAPVIDEEKRTSQVLTRQMEATEKKMDISEQALEQFATAISEYARHLSSHTSAIQSLAEASHELKKGAAAQNHILMDLLRNVEERRLGKEALAPIMHIDIAPREKPAPTAGKPRWERVLPSYRALHQPKPAKPAPVADEPAPEPEKPVFEGPSLVEAMVLPYYWAFYKLEKERLAPGVEKPAFESKKSKARAKKAVEAIMFPFYRTLYQREPENSLPAAEMTVPIAEKKVFNSRKSLFVSNKPDDSKTPPIPRDSIRIHPPGCSRHRHPLKPQ